MLRTVGTLLRIDDVIVNLRPKSLCLKVIDRFFLEFYAHIQHFGDLVNIVGVARGGTDGIRRE